MIYSTSLKSIVKVNDYIIASKYALLMAFIKNAFVCINKKVKLINHHCLPILMLLYIMLCIMLAHSLLFAALSHAICLYNAYFLPLIFANALYFHTLSWFIDTVCLFQTLFHIMHSAINLLVFLILCSHLFCNERAMCSLEK